MDVGARKLELTIGTLVIDGLGRVDSDALAAGARAELARLLGAHGLPGRLPGHARTLQAPPINGRVAGTELGAAVGRAVYGALGR